MYKSRNYFFNHRQRTKPWSAGSPSPLTVALFRVWKRLIGRGLRKIARSKRVNKPNTADRFATRKVLGPGTLCEVKLILLETVPGAISKLDVRFTTSNEYPRRLPAIFSIKLTKLKRNRGSPAQRKQNTSPLTKTRLPKKMGRPNTLRVSIFFAKNGQPNKKWKPDCQQIKRLSFSSVHKTNPQKWHLFPNTSSSVCKNASFFPINLITQIFAFPKTNCRLMIFTPSKMRVIRS